MKSAADMLDGRSNEEWNAREWFVVNDAAVQLTEANRLVPKVKMGVEARQQVRGADGLEDAKIQSPDHPLVKYAETFTEKFDLIAERKSVIYHLRELAKATALAKFFLDAKVLAGVYGGVSMGMDQFQLAAPTAPPGTVPRPPP